MCSVRRIGPSLRFVTRRQRDEMVEDLKPICAAINAGEGDLAAGRVGEHLGADLAGSVMSHISAISRTRGCEHRGRQLPGHRLAGRRPFEMTRMPRLGAVQAVTP